jgi:hypothetical protein
MRGTVAASGSLAGSCATRNQAGCGYEHGTKRWRTRAEKSRIVWAIVGFVAFQAALAFGVDQLWPGVRDPLFAFKKAALRQRMVEAPGRPLVLALGSSRTVADLRAELLSDRRYGPVVFNFGLAGGGPILELVSLQRLLASGIRPEVVLIEIVPPFLNRQAGPLEERYLDSARLAGGEVMRVARYYNAPQRLLRHWCDGRALPCDRHQAELREALGRLWTHAEAAIGAGNGWSPYEAPKTEEERLQLPAQVYEQFRKSFTNYESPRGAVQALRHLMDTCRRERITPVLVLLPESSRFRSWYAGDVLAGIDHLVTELSGAYGAAVIDARTWIGDDGFCDGHHLSAAGATTFTERFGKEALGPLLRRRQ